MKWKSRNKELSDIFMNWICKSDVLIIPSLENKKLPPSTFPVTKKLITIDWGKSFTKKNLNKTVFPILDTVLMLDSNNNKKHIKNIDFTIIRGYEEKIIYKDLIYWNNVYVNKEWLESQYHEYICAMQEFYKLRENELR